MRCPLTLLTLGAVALAFAAVPRIAADDDSHAAPASQPCAVPARTIQEIRQLLTPPRRRLTPQQIAARVTEAYELGAKAERQYPGAANLQEIRRDMLYAAGLLASWQKDEAAFKRHCRY